MFFSYKPIKRVKHEHYGGRIRDIFRNTFYECLKFCLLFINVFDIVSFR